MTVEIWKPIENFENEYEISNMGNVRSKTRFIHYADGRIIKRNGIIRKPVEVRGYLQINLSKNGQTIRKYVHDLVAQAFIPNPHGYTEINHKDYNKHNNCVDNLEWCNHQYNINDMHQHYNIKIHHNICINCGKETQSYKALRCLQCDLIFKQSKSRKPNREQLKALIRCNSMIKIGKMFGVTDNSIRKWCQYYNLPYKYQDIKKYNDEEWNYI